MGLSVALIVYCAAVGRMTTTAELARQSDVPKEIAWAQTQFQSDARLRQIGTIIVDTRYSLPLSNTNPFILGKRAERACRKANKS